MPRSISAGIAGFRALSVGGAAPAILAMSWTPPAATTGVAYNSAPMVTGGIAPYIFVITAGALPAGLTLNPATGAVTGTPTTAATYAFTIAVTDATGSANVATSIAVSAASPAYVVFFAGQSNGGSHGTTGSDVPAGLQGAMADINIWNGATNAWEVYQAGVNSDRGQMGGTTPQYWGAEAEFARRWKVDKPGVPLYIVKLAISSTSIDPRARADAEHDIWDPGTRSELYDDLLALKTAAFANLGAAGKTPVVRSFAWIQGENETLIVEAANDYQTTLTNFIASIRSDIIGASTPFIVSRVADNASWTYRSAVRAAQVAVAESVAYVRWVDADALPLGDAVHYNAAGVVELGKRLYESQQTGAEVSELYSARLAAPLGDAQKGQLATCVQALINGSVYPAIVSLNFLSETSVNRALMNLKPTVFANLALLTGATHTPGLGVTGGGSAAAMNTGINLATSDLRTLRQTSNGISFGVANDVQSAGNDIGVAATTFTIISVETTTSTANYRLNANNVAAANAWAPANSKGIYTFVRLSNGQRPFKDGVALLAVDTQSSTALPNADVYLGGRNGGTNYTPERTHNFLAFHAGFTDAQAVVFQNAIATYMAAAGLAS